MRSILPLAAAATFLMFSAGIAGAQPRPSDWRTAEAPMLRNHVQLTFPEQFVKAGEAYFNADASWIIFQAVPRPAGDEEPATIYSMYVAKLKREGDRVIDMHEPILVSAPGSANTCGFFHPTEPGRIIFGSTIVPPHEGPDAGYQRGSNAYRWAFPDQMEVVTTVVPEIVRDLTGADVNEPMAPATPIWTNPGYDAECAYSPDGRYIVHTRVNPETNDPDLYVYDTKTGAAKPVVQMPGYDGGPFFSADGRRITYRSDREGNDLLQIFVMDFIPDTDAEGAPTLRFAEHQLTKNAHVNWAPYWHPSGEYLVYTTSEVSHMNYEVFAIDAPAYGEADNAPPRSRQITFAEGFDGMPVFTNDGRLMMWTSQRGEKIEGESRPSSQIWIANVVDVKP